MNNNLNNLTNPNALNAEIPNQTSASQQNGNVGIKTDFSSAKGNAVKLTRFKYKVKDQTGKVIDSYFDAENKVDVESFLLNKGYQVVSIEEDKLSTKLGLVSSVGKMSTKDLTFFLTHFL